LIPKRDPDPTKVIKEKHFRHKTIAEQQKVLEDHYPDYRESGACEVITAVLLCYRMHKEELLSGSQLRCKESTRFGKRATVGNFIPEGLRLDTGLNDLPIEFEGRALARKL